MARKHDTAREALDGLEGKVKDNQLSPIAEELQRRARLREQRDAEVRARLAAMRGQGGGPDAA
ncbi:MAG TPA: hypothetical protein VNS81_06520 [Nocardioides sp.]|nr:hypothetical protein [Nocardioides sp.]